MLVSQFCNWGLHYLDNPATENNWKSLIKDKNYHFKSTQHLTWQYRITQPKLKGKIFTKEVNKDKSKFFIEGFWQFSKYWIFILKSHRISSSKTELKGRSPHKQETLPTLFSDPKVLPAPRAQVNQNWGSSYMGLQLKSDSMGHSENLKTWSRLKVVPYC